MSEEEIFHEVLARSPTQRAEYLDQSCAGNPDLRAAVEALLRANVGASGFLDGPALSATVDLSTVVEHPGTMIGPYKLLEQIGEGGMGTVWTAQQSEPVKRVVALKLIKAGMDSKQVIARFEAERQALALMDHPNIAKVFDGGMTGEPEAQARYPLARASGSGRPFFVMELVKGVPITKYCDDHRLTPGQRLELFVPVCHAIQHAHQKGIIHRDLKPSNVLVALYDGKPVPKVIDFGVAKAAGASLTEKTLVTGFGAIVGTLEYMSPEQAETNQLDIDTRSDIYSLGVLLYELLTGSTPFSKKDLEKAGMLEMLRVIREQEPSKPSTKLSSSDALPSLSASRGTEPAKLTKLIRGELDWIVMKALEKDRSRRYETANGFAIDVQRYLADEAVQACPPSAGYRLRKFVRRNRGQVSAAAVVLLCLIGGIAGTTWGLVRAVQARTEAQGEASDARVARAAEEEQRQFAEKEKTRAEENLKQARAAVDKLLTRVAQELANKPHMEQIRRALLLDALEFYQGFLAQKGTDPEMRHETARAHARVAEIQEMLGHGPKAEAAMRQAIALLEELAADFPGVPSYTEELVHCRTALSQRFYWAGRHEESVRLRRQALADWEKLAADFPTVPHYQRQLALAHTWLGNSLKNSAGRLPEAEKHYRQALVVWRKVRASFPKEPEDRWSLSCIRLYLGALLRDSSRLPEAEPELRQAVALRERLLAEAPDDTALISPPVHTRTGLLGFKYAGGQAPDRTDRMGDLAHAQEYLAILLVLAGKPHEAVQYCQRALAIREKLRDDFPHDAEQQRRLGWEYKALSRALRDLGRTQEAEGALRKAVAVNQKLVADHPDVPPFPSDLAGSYSELGLLLYDNNWAQDAADVFRQLRQHYEDAAAKFPGDYDSQAALAWFLGTCPLPQFHDGERAAATAKRALQLRPTSRGGWRTLGIAQYRAGKWSEAVEALEKSTELGGGGEPREWYFLAMAHWQRGEQARAQKWYNQAVESTEKAHSQSGTLRRFRAEAERVLRVKEEPGPDKK